MPKRVYNEVYCDSTYTEDVENAILALRLSHPEWELDMSLGINNWEEDDE